MLVKAIRDGYYGHVRVKEDSTFHIKDEAAFSSIWMKKMKKGKPSKEIEVEPVELELPKKDADVI